MIYSSNSKPKQSEVGGKAFNLYHLKSSGLMVPDWFVLPDSFFYDFLGDKLKDYKELLSKYSSQKRKEIIELIKTCSFSDAQKNEIAEILEKTFLPDTKIAVRSSASDEDGDTYCFAGMLDSFLYLENKLNTVLDAIKKCYCSAFSERIMQYREENGLINDKISVAVVVQEMIDPDYSGVIFTTNPVTNNTDEMIISTVKGVGEQLVSGEVSSSDYCVNCLEEIVDRTETDTISLSDEQVIDLYRFADKIERSYPVRRSVDIEYCVKDGRIYALQCRPITRYTAIDKNQPRTILDNSNIIESYAGVTTPLTYSFAREVYGKIYRQTLRSFYIKESDIQKIAYDLDHMLYFYENKIYYRLNGWYKMTALYPGYNKNKRYMETMMGVKTPINESNMHQSRRLVKIYARFIRKMIHMKRDSKAFIERFNEVVAPYYDKNLDDYSARELVKIYEQLEKNILDDFVTPISNDMGTMVFYGMLTEAVKKLKIKDFDLLLTGALTNGRNVESVKQTTDLIALCGEIRKNPNYIALFEHNNSYVKRYLSKYPNLESSINDYLSLYGPRTADELKLETITMQQDVTILYDMIRDYLALEKLPKISERNIEKSEEAFIAKVPKMKRAYIKRLLKTTKYFIRNRESLRLRRTYIYSVVRNIFLGIGKDFEKNGLIDNYRDIFFLEKNEIFDAVKKGKAIEARKLIDARRKEYNINAKKPIYDRIYFFGDTVSENSLPIFAKENNDNENALCGTAGGNGVVEGIAKIVDDPKHADVKGCILIAKRTDPGWTTLFPAVKGIAIEHGSMLSHSAVIAREMKIPLVVGVKDLTTRVSDGDYIRLDGANGKIEIIND